MPGLCDLDFSSVFFGCLLRSRCLEFGKISTLICSGKAFGLLLVVLLREAAAVRGCHCLPGGPGSLTLADSHLIHYNRDKARV